MSEEGNGRKALLVVGIAVVERERGRHGAERSCRLPLRGRCWSICFIPTNFGAMEEDESQMKRS